MAEKKAPLRKGTYGFSDVIGKEEEYNSIPTRSVESTVEYIYNKFPMNKDLIKKIIVATYKHMRDEVIEKGIFTLPFVGYLYVRKPKSDVVLHWNYKTKTKTYSVRRRNLAFKPLRNWRQALNQHDRLAVSLTQEEFNKWIEDEKLLYTKNRQLVKKQVQELEELVDGKKEV